MPARSVHAATRRTTRRQFLQLALGAGLAGAASLLRLPAAEAAEAPAASALFTVPGSTPAVALTFDDGFVNVSRLLEVCRPLGLRLTLFPIGKVIEAQPELWRQAVADGHEIGCHTYSHPALGGQPYAVVANELRQFVDVVRAQLGEVPVRWFRPPYGSGWSSAAVQTAARDLGFRVAMWNQANSAPGKPGAKEVLAAFKKDARPGNVVLYHFNWHEVAALEGIAAYCQAQGWRLGTLSELVDAGLMVRSGAAVDAGRPGVL